MLESKSPSGKGIAGAADTAQPLLDALTDTILDTGSPAVCNPFLTALFQRATKQRLASATDGVAAKVRLWKVLCVWIAPPDKGLVPAMIAQWVLSRLPCLR